MSGQNQINKIEMAINKAIKGLPRLIGTEAVNFYKQRFREQAWSDNTTEPWAKRKDNAKRNKGRAILVDKGRLRNSIRITQITENSVTIGNSVPYAKAHNEGFKGLVNVKAHKRNRYKKVDVYSIEVFSIKSKQGRKSRITQVAGSGEVKAHTRFMNLPKRQFMGKSAVLEQRLKRVIRAYIIRTIKTT